MKQEKCKISNSCYNVLLLVGISFLWKVLLLYSDRHNIIIQCIFVVNRLPKKKKDVRVLNS